MPGGEFDAGICRAMRAAGLRGRPVSVSFKQGMLRLDGAKAGTLAIPIGSIERIRIGFHDGEASRSYCTLVWRTGEARPLALQPMPPHRSYSALVRRLAAELSASRGLAAVERGTSFGLAIWNFGVWALACASVLLISWLYWEWSLWPLLLLSIVLGAPTVYAWIEMRRKHLPRPVGSLDELALQLP